ncbi:MAG: Hsp20/alpha crystallin family protein [Alphaproteobacteria bacterium]|nr:Hsp20/alpha crystallin family protein [Alphaproteobacteria bacterium]
MSISDNQKEYGKVPNFANGEFHNFVFNLWNMFGNQPHDGVEFSESRNRVNIAAFIPEANEEELDVQISADGYLHISGEMKREPEIKQQGKQYSGNTYQNFRRTFYLPWNLDFNKATAEYKDGILNIEIPKFSLEKSKTKKIALKKKKNSATVISGGKGVCSNI